MAAAEKPPPVQLGAEHFRAIADYTYDWETWIGPAGQVLWVNPAVERITGYGVGECLELAEYPLELVYEPDRAGVRAMLERARAGDSGNHFEFRVRRKDGRVRWAAISWQPLISAGGDNLGYRSSVRDIDERKQLESQLHEALRQAESASIAKSEFLANVSHELRTPLSSIVGYAQLLAAAGLAPPLSGYVTTLLEQGELLDRLVSDLLDYSSLQAGVLPLRAEPYEPRALVEAVLRALSPVAAGKHLWLRAGRMQAPERCVGDPVRVSQVLSNLVTNALKFTERGGADVAVDTDLAAGEYRVTVDDTGPGMPDDQTLFAPFRQAQSHAARNAGGVGLGLAISRQLCERMGGALESGTSPAGGARFVATFPIRAQGAAPSALESFRSEESAAPVERSFAERYPLCVLVIDDMEPAREFMRAALRALGYEAALAASAAEGLRLAEAHGYGLVLVDIQMPGVDGWTAARGLRARLGARPFLVALTANALANDAGLLESAGFDGFAQKPLRFRELQALLRRACERVGSAGLPPPGPAAEPPGASGPSAAGELDPERRRELAAITLEGGESLLDRMWRRVTEALPEARRRLAAAREAAAPPELARALHDLHGLLSLIGAGRASALLKHAEQVVEADPAAIAWAAIDERLEALAAELARGPSVGAP